MEDQEHVKLTMDSRKAPWRENFRRIYRVGSFQPLKLRSLLIFVREMSTRGAPRGGGAMPPISQCSVGTLSFKLRLPNTLESKLRVIESDRNGDEKERLEDKRRWNLKHRNWVGCFVEQNRVVDLHLVCRLQVVLGLMSREMKFKI